MKIVTFMLLSLIVLGCSDNYNPYQYSTFNCFNENGEVKVNVSIDPTAAFQTEYITTVKTSFNKTNIHKLNLKSPATEIVFSEKAIAGKFTALIKVGKQDESRIKVLFETDSSGLKSVCKTMKYEKRISGSTYSLVVNGAPLSSAILLEHSGIYIFNCHVDHENKIINVKTITLLNNKVE